MFVPRINVDGAVRWLPRVEARIIANTHTALYHAAELTLEVARGTPLFQDRTGKLRNSLGIIDPGGFKIRVRARTPYAGYVEFGTPAHMIPARGRTLAFQWHGHMMFRRYVMHPGTKPRPFMERAGEAGERDLLLGMNAAVDKAVAE